MQSTLGHGGYIVPAPFKRYVNLTNGEEQNVYCPTDENFLKYMSDVITKISEKSPDFIMLDDDFRLVARPDKGCACPKHLKMLPNFTAVILPVKNY